MREEEIRAAIGRIAPGNVLTHSQITSEACSVVGRVQNRKPEGWHRVVYKDGRLKNALQRELLEKEGVRFVSDWRVELGD